MKNRERWITRKNLTLYTSLGALAGAVVGSIAGALGMAMGWGIVLGLCVGAVIDVRRRERIGKATDDTDQARR